MSRRKDGETEDKWSLMEGGGRGRQINGVTDEEAGD